MDSSCKMKIRLTKDAVFSNLPKRNYVCDFGKKFMMDTTNETEAQTLQALFLWHMALFCFALICDFWVAATPNEILREVILL